MIRTAKPADRPVLFALQRLLPERAPSLLDHAIRAGDVLVSTGDRFVSTDDRFDPRTSTGVEGPLDDVRPDSDASGDADAAGAPLDVRFVSGGGDEGVPVGYLLPVSGAEVHVAELVVAPESRREGRATALLRVLFDSLAAGTPVTLAVDPDNRAALALYRSVGFAVTDRREGYFDSGPALLCSRVVAGD